MELGGKLTQPIVVGDQLFVASTDAHTLHALDATDGTQRWRHTVDGRIDAPPCWHKGILYFGTRTGWLHALRAADGSQVWARRVAPGDEQLVAYNQVESVWPLHGNPVVVDDMVYIAAGRNVYLDGGLHVVGLDAATGELRCQAHLAKPLQDAAKEKGHPHELEGVVMDVMSWDGTYLYLGNIILDRSLKRQPDDTGGKRIMATEGLLDDRGWNRNLWKYSANFPTIGERTKQGLKLTGQLLVHDDRLVYGVQYFLSHSGQSAVFYPGQEGYKLYADNIDTAAVSWKKMLPLRIRAMTKAGDVLFVAGPPDEVDPGDPLAAFEGRKGGLLSAFTAADGQPLAEFKLGSPPVFDGLIAAGGRLYMSARDGSVVCFREHPSSNVQRSTSNRK